MEVGSEARALGNNQNMVRSVSHALQCREANCGQPSCMKMKSVMAHTKLCKRKTYGSCHICLELITHCKYHANNCILTKCPVPFCSKMKIKQQRYVQNWNNLKNFSYRFDFLVRLQQVQLLQNPQSVAMVKPLYMTYQPGIGVTPGSKTFVNQVRRFQYIQIENGHNWHTYIHRGQLVRAKNKVPMAEDWHC